MRLQENPHILLDIFAYIPSEVATLPMRSQKTLIKSREGVRGDNDFRVTASSGEEQDI